MGTGRFVEAVRGRRAGLLDLNGLRLRIRP
jgi:hypothetical protein